MVNTNMLIVYSYSYRLSEKGESRQANYSATIGPELDRGAIEEQKIRRIIED